MKHIEYDKKGNITWISSDMDWQYRRGNVSKELWKSIENYFNNKKGKKHELI